MPASMLALYLPSGVSGSDSSIMRKFCTTPPDFWNTASAKAEARSDTGVWLKVASMPRRALTVSTSTVAPLTCRMARRSASATASDALAPKPSAVTFTVSSLPTSGGGMVAVSGVSGAGEGAAAGACATASPRRRRRGDRLRRLAVAAGRGQAQRQQQRRCES